MLLSDKLLAIAREYPELESISTDQVREVLNRSCIACLEYICDELGTDENGVCYATTSDARAIYKQVDNIWKQTMSVLEKEDRNFAKEDGFRILVKEMYPDTANLLKW